MHRATPLHFQQLPAAARRAALWRLAWTGLAPEQIARRTGLTPEQVRRALHEELAPPQPSWAQREHIAANA